MTFEQWLKHIDYQHFAMQPASIVKRVLHMAWQASRENQQEYKKHEFCRDMECYFFEKDTCSILDCYYDPKEFLCWLKDNGYRIVRDK